MKEFLVLEQAHNSLIESAYKTRGYDEKEANSAVFMCAMASRYGIKTHNALKALHLDDLFGSKVEGCVPRAKIEKLETRFEGSEVWNANQKLGQAVAKEAFTTCIKLADKYGVGIVSVDNAFHYLWGGGYVIDVAKKGYFAYTNCTSALAEVVPFQGKFPSLGTNPHSWAFPTQDIIGFPICIDWATSAMSMGRVQQLKREGGSLPFGIAIDEKGNPTENPESVYALLPFGAHKGYSLSIINELYAAYIGGFLPTIRGKSKKKKSSCNFFFQVIHPEALNAKAFVLGSVEANVKAIVEDILSHGNENCLLPGELEAKAAKKSEELGGLIFSENEIEEFNKLSESLNLNYLEVTAL